MKMVLREDGWEGFGERPECYCDCGYMFKAQTEAAVVDGALVHFIERACPLCERFDQVRRVSFPPERLTLRGQD